MEKYKRFVSGEYFDYIAFAFGIILALIAFIVLSESASKPLDTTDLNEFNTKVQLLEQDFANITSMENIVAKTDENGITVTFEGSEFSLNAYFTKDGIYTHSAVIDKRLTSSFGTCFMLVLMAFVIGSCVGFIIQGVLYIPVVIMFVIKGVCYVYSELKKRANRRVI